MIEVRASVEDEQGRGDGAYSLLGKWKIPDFLKELEQTLYDNWGLTNSDGPFTLNIQIERVKGTREKRFTVMSVPDAEAWFVLDRATGDSERADSMKEAGELCRKKNAEVPLAK